PLTCPHRPSGPAPGSDDHNARCTCYGTGHDNNGRHGPSCRRRSSLDPLERVHARFRSGSYLLLPQVIIRSSEIRHSMSSVVQFVPWIRPSSSRYRRARSSACCWRAVTSTEACGELSQPLLVVGSEDKGFG